MSDDNAEWCACGPACEHRGGAWCKQQATPAHFAALKARLAAAERACVSYMEEIERLRDKLKASTAAHYTDSVALLDHEIESASRLLNGEQRNTSGARPLHRGQPDGQSGSSGFGVTYCKCGKCESSRRGMPDTWPPYSPPKPSVPFRGSPSSGDRMNAASGSEISARERPNE